MDVRAIRSLIWFMVRSSCTVYPIRKLFVVSNTDCHYHGWGYICYPSIYSDDTIFMVLDLATFLQGVKFRKKTFMCSSLEQVILLRRSKVTLDLHSTRWQPFALLQDANGLWSWGRGDKIYQKTFLDYTHTPMQMVYVARGWLQWLQWLRCPRLQLHIVNIKGDISLAKYLQTSHVIYVYKYCGLSST